jgi:hypothetical protein
MILQWHTPDGKRCECNAQKEKPPQLMELRGYLDLAERTGLEPATSDVTGRHSNQLNYHSFVLLLDAA